jgi:hypothetical protein
MLIAGQERDRQEDERSVVNIASIVMSGPAPGQWPTVETAAAFVPWPDHVELQVPSDWLPARERLSE